MLMIFSVIYFSMIFLSNKINNWWLVQNFFFFFFFMYFKIPMFNYFLNISYLFGMDMFSYLMLMLSIWNVSLVYMASINLKFKYYYYFNMLM